MNLLFNQVNCFNFNTTKHFKKKNPANAGFLNKTC